MPYCPVCEDEFRPGFTVCPDCNAELVDELPVDEPTEEPEPQTSGFDGARTRAAGHPDDDFIVEVFRGVPGVQFDLVHSFLQANGLHVHVQTIGAGRWLDIGAVSALTRIPTDFNAARILVRAEDEQAAREALAAAEAGHLSVEGESGSNGIAFYAGRLVIAFLFLVIL